VVTNKACQLCQGKIQAHTSIQYTVHVCVCVMLFFAMQCLARQGNAMQCKKPVAPPFTVTPAAERFRIHRGNRRRPNLRLQMGFPYVFRNPPTHKHFQPTKWKEQECIRPQQLSVGQLEKHKDKGENGMTRKICRLQNSC
jgi:hypothetical protein